MSAYPLMTFLSTLPHQTMDQLAYPFPNHDDICTQSQPTELPPASDSSVKKDVLRTNGLLPSLVTLRGRNFVLIVILLPLKLAHLLAQT